MSDAVMMQFERQKLDRCILMQFVRQKFDRYILMQFVFRAKTAEPRGRSLFEMKVTKVRNRIRCLAKPH